MNANTKKKIDILIYILALVSIAVIVAFINSNLLWHTNAIKYINKMYKQSKSIKDNREFLYKSKVYRILFSTPENEKDKLYLQCFEEKLNGLVYKPTYGASQGESKSIYGMTNHFINNSTHDSFFIVYGYNKELEANSFSVKRTDSGEWITQDVSTQEYFLYIYTNIEYGKIIFKDAQNHDLTKRFNGQ